jgi:hypothetical protein
MSVPSSIKLLLARGSSATDGAGKAEVIVKIPGTFGLNSDGSMKAGRTISGGWGYFASQADGDYCYADVRDDDNILGYGAGAVLDTFHDLDVPASNQGWFFPRQEVLELRPLVTDDPSRLPCGMYLHIFGQKGVVGVDTFFVNLHWGVRLR